MPFYRHGEVALPGLLVLLLHDHVEVGRPVDHDEVALRDVGEDLRGPGGVKPDRPVGYVLEFRNC